MASFKSFEMARELGDRYRKSAALAAVTMVEGIGTNGDPTILFGTGVSRGPNAFIRIAEITNPTAKDSLGLTAGAYTPHVVQLATEANFAGTTDNIADNITTVRLLDLLGELFMTGCQIEWYQEADGTTPTETTITASKLKGTFNPHRYWPLMGQ
jgi:hypothetical protein